MSKKQSIVRKQQSELHSCLVLFAALGCPLWCSGEETGKLDNQFLKYWTKVHAIFVLVLLGNEYLLHGQGDWDWVLLYSTFPGLLLSALAAYVLSTGKRNSANSPDSGPIKRSDQNPKK
jgi:hypothetical protein